jgi:hypothetical protein
MKTLIIDETQAPTTLETQTQVKEGIVGETLTVSLVGSLISALTCYDAEADCEIVEAGSAYMFTASTPGVYRLKATSSVGVRQVLIRVVPRATLDAIPDAETRTGYGSSPARRLVLRSVVNHAPEAWNGSADWFFDNRIKLSDHGVIVPQ